jgi:rhamnulokinase
VSTPVVAVDFGATSVRVCRVELSSAGADLRVVLREPHAPVADGRGGLRWDWGRLVVAMRAGIEEALRAGPVASIGIDTWGVDYGLLDAHGALVAQPWSYRDGRTERYREIAERIGERRLFEISGVQQMPINTLFQLAVHDRDELARARHVVMLPELLAHDLTGTISAERTTAGTTALYDLRTRTWSEELCDAISLERSLLPEIGEPGTVVGGALDFGATSVRLVGGHDTASAVVAGGAPGEVFLSTGTWMLVGREQTAWDTSDRARELGFTNEQGTFGTIRFLRNMAGWWLLEECRRAWGSTSVDELLAAAASTKPAGRPFDTTDDRFLAPADMAAEVRAAASLGHDAAPPVVTRAIVEAMVDTTARLVAALEPTQGIRVFGGAARSGLFTERLLARIGLPVRLGPVEAAALGNALTQGVALGVYDSLDVAREATKAEPLYA